jgi:hypothetical protein
MACLLILSTTMTFASDQPLLLDASCKILCVVSVKEVITSQTQSFQREYANIYSDFRGLTREQLDNKTVTTEMNKLCRSAFNEKSFIEASNCLTFKH